jgi:hypothetical protein
MRSLTADLLSVLFEHLKAMLESSEPAILMLNLV